MSEMNLIIENWRKFLNEHAREPVEDEEIADVPHSLTFAELRMYLSSRFGKAKITLTNSHLDLEASYIQKTGSLKPDGIWYGCGTTWLDFIDTQMSGPGSNDTQIWSLKIDMTNVFSMATVKEIDRFTRRYKDVERYYAINDLTVDWSLVSPHFDGIECCPYPVGDWDFKMKYMWYYGIDMSSGCIWNPAAITNSMLVAELKEDGWEVYV